MRIDVNSNEEKFNKIEIVRNENENHYQVYIDGAYGDKKFNCDCKKCDNIEIGFDLLENGETKILEGKGNKS